MSVLGPALAQNFIDKITENFKFNVNIMNSKGIIIASKDETRIGDFHEVASGMLNGTIDTGIVNGSEKYLGAKPGINMFIDYKGEHVGVICVTGNPDTVEAFAGLVKASMEIMLESESQIEKTRIQRNNEEDFLYYLLFEQVINKTKVDSWADDLNIDKNLIRIPVLIKFPSSYDYKEIIRVLRRAEGYSNKDIMTISRNNNIIIFKSVGSKSLENIQGYKKIIQDYISKVLSQLPNRYDGEKFNFHIGTLQNDIKKYRTAFNHAQKLALITEGEQICFFTDYVLDYYRSIVTMKEYDDIFSLYNRLIDEQDKKMISETVKALNENNYNIVNTSKKLFLHRNTVLFRFNKIKEILNVDPIQRASDREFLNELVYYFDNK